MYHAVNVWDFVYHFTHRTNINQQNFKACKSLTHVLLGTRLRVGL